MEHFEQKQVVTASQRGYNGSLAMSSHNLPPVRHLPQWTRVGHLGKPCSPRRLPPNKLQPLPVVAPADKRVWRAAEVSCHSDPDPHVASMRRNIQFLQQQHKDTLEKLHAEIEYLRRENKELQYKMIMEPPKSCRKDGSDILGCARQEPSLEVKGGLITSLQPLRIHSNPSHPPRAPTLQECEVIIRQLYNANSLQSQEIIRVKALLRDIVLSKKITPENYILTKAFLVDGTRSGPSHSGVVLPALKQSLSSSIADRQRRTRAVQRDRFKRTVH
ncbi:hypothetical protein F7725_015345 [Dissostichus mawsoni]|uniref:Uncharacterized protein n=1 Tax=Dissostichus mawsoni TaxID=36200 RepID=A0A7J5YKM2_DISMA|nr:hypothetical protein F7725_015345 [Dissostichus mawsoni]